MRKPPLAAAALVAAAVALAAPAAASAATFTTIEYSSVIVTYKAAEGAPHTITVSGTPDALTITDPTDTITTPSGNGCTVSADQHALTCSAVRPGVKVSAEVFGGDRDDTMTSTVTGYPGGFFSIAGLRVALLGGAGADTLVGGPAGEVLGGDAGADTVRAGGGNDVLGLATSASGGAEPDRLMGEAGDDFIAAGGVGDVVDGGSGTDAVVSSTTSPAGNGSAPMTMRLGGGDTTTTGNGYLGQNLSLTRVETAYGGAGNDTLVGSAGGSETLVGLGGGDTIDGGGGIDFLYGYDGPDPFSASQTTSIEAPPRAVPPDAANTITSRDGGFDVVDCGREGGTVDADDVDRLTRCPAPGRGTTLSPVPPQATPVVTQTVQVPAPFTRPVPVFDTRKPVISRFTAPKSVKGTALRKTGRYTLSFTTSEATRGTAALSAKGAAFAAAGELELATTSITTKAGAKQTVRLTVTNKLRRLLKKGRRFTLRVTVVDGGGNQTTKSQTVKVG